MQLPRQSEDPVKPKKIRSTDDFGITGSTVYYVCLVQGEPCYTEVNGAISEEF